MQSRQDPGWTERGSQDWVPVLEERPPGPRPVVVPCPGLARLSRDLPGWSRDRRAQVQGSGAEPCSLGCAGKPAVFSGNASTPQKQTQRPVAVPDPRAGPSPGNRGSAVSLCRVAYSGHLPCVKSHGVCGRLTSLLVVSPRGVLSVVCPGPRSFLGLSTIPWCGRTAGRAEPLGALGTRLSGACL